MFWDCDPINLISNRLLQRRIIPVLFEEAAFKQFPANDVFRLYVPALFPPVFPAVCIVCSK